MASAADKKRWDDLHTALEKATEARAAYDRELYNQYRGASGRYELHWLPKGKRDKLERLDAAKDKIGDKIIDMIVRVSPRGDRWLSGVPSHWLRNELTWEDMIRPVNEPLSVVVPGAWGYRDGHMSEQDHDAHRAYEEQNIMASRRKTSKGRGGSSGGANPRNSREISEQQHEEAMRILRAEYFQGVRSIVGELQSAIKDGEITSEDELNDRVHQNVDGSYWVIYTHANFQVLMCSDNHDAYSEEYGEAPVEGSDIKWAALAFAAMERDVRDLMGAEGIHVGDQGVVYPHDVDEAPRGRMRETRGPRGLRRGR